MVKEYNYIRIQEILSRLLRHPMLQDITLEAVIQHVLDFLSIFGCPKMFEDKECDIDIHEYRGVLPCDCILINQIKDYRTGICLRAMTDTFHSKDNSPTFKTQGNVLYVSFKEGKVQIPYKSIPTDEDGFPMLIDNNVFLKTLEAYIKKEAFTVLFDMGKINLNVLTNVQQEYSWRAGQCQSEFNLPSESEMQSISNMWCTLLQKNNKFYEGFKGLGDKQILNC